MDFNSHKPIYLQICDQLYEKILSGELHPEDRISSVRELGVELGVNPNTVMRSYDNLQNNGIIYNKRGIGYFITINAKELVFREQKDYFIKEDLPLVFKKMDLYGIKPEDLVVLYKESNNV